MAVGTVGVVTALLGALVGLRATATLADLVADDGVLSADALVTLEGSIVLAQDTVATLEGSLARIETTTRDLAVAFEEGEDLLVATAELSEDEIAPSIAAVEQAMPGLVEAASVIDTALVALSAIPFGPAYDPAEPFDESLRRLEQQLDGLPEDLETQAALIREAGASLGDVRRGTGEVADDLALLHGHLGEAAVLLDGYAETAEDAAAMVTDGRAALGRHLFAARLLIVALGLVLAAGQLVPIGAGWLLLHPERITAFLDSVGPDEPARVA
jgi:hypothetical protein